MQKRSHSQHPRSHSMDLVHLCTNFNPRHFRAHSWLIRPAPRRYLCTIFISENHPKCDNEGLLPGAGVGVCAVRAAVHCSRTSAHTRSQSGATLMLTLMPVFETLKWQSSSRDTVVQRLLCHTLQLVFVDAGLALGGAVGWKPAGQLAWPGGWCMITRLCMDSTLLSCCYPALRVSAST